MAERTITVKLTQERFEAAQWAISMAINLRNMAIQEALIEASNDFGRAALATPTQPGVDRGELEGHRPREITRKAEYLADIAGVMEYPGITPGHMQIALDAIEANGEEVCPHGTREIADKLTIECPDCNGEIGGGGGNSDEPEWTCETCVVGRVPASTQPLLDLDALKERLVSDEAVGAFCAAAFGYQTEDERYLQRVRVGLEAVRAAAFPDAEGGPDA